MKNEKWRGGSGKRETGQSETADGEKGGEDPTEKARRGKMGGGGEGEEGEGAGGTEGRERNLGTIGGS